MEKTHHAATRMQQRALGDALVEIIINHGRHEHLPGGAIGIFLGEKEYREINQELRRFQKRVESAKNAKVVIKDGKILTCYKNQRANLSVS